MCATMAALQLHCALRSDLDRRCSFALATSTEQVFAKPKKSLTPPRRSCDNIASARGAVLEAGGEPVYLSLAHSNRRIRLHNSGEIHTICAAESTNLDSRCSFSLASSAEAVSSKPKQFCAPPRRSFNNIASARGAVEAGGGPVNRRIELHNSGALHTNCAAELTSDLATNAVGRREVLNGVLAALAATTIGMSTTDSAFAAGKAPKGFSAVLDNADGYAFFYPFGWQEVAVKGQDVAFKDVIEPLESVSVSIVKTDKTTLEELGSPDDVAKALVNKVLSSPTQKTTLKDAKARVTNGRTYYQFEFTAEARNFTRHALGAVAVSGGKFFTLTTGANERRWGKIEDKLRLVVESFTTL